MAYSIPNADYKLTRADALIAWLQDHRDEVNRPPTMQIIIDCSSGTAFVMNFRWNVSSQGKVTHLPNG